MSEPVAVTNCYQIEKAIKDFIESMNENQMVFKAVDVSKRLPELSQPGFSVAVTEGEFDVQSMDDEINEKVSITVSLVVKNLASEEQRRIMMHAATACVIQKLHGQTLGLEIEPITVKKWYETTSAEQQDAQLTVADIHFETEFSLLPSIAEHSYHELVSICSSFVSENEPNETLMESRVDFTNGEP